MAKMRYISDSFWSDNWIEELDPLEKYLYLYLLTNQYVSICGIYEINERRIAFETGIDRDMIKKMLARFQEAGKVFYVDGFLLIINFVKNQNITSENDNLWKGIMREIEDIGLDKLKPLLSHKGVIRGLQGAYKGLIRVSQYLTLLNLTLLNLTDGDETDFSNEKSTHSENTETSDKAEITKTTEATNKTEVTETKKAITKPIIQNKSLVYLQKQAENIDKDIPIHIPEFAEKYEDEWKRFVLWWTEPDSRGKIRATKEKTFEIKRRFATWMSRKVDKNPIVIKEKPNYGGFYPKPGFDDN